MAPGGGGEQEGREGGCQAGREGRGLDGRSAPREENGMRPKERSSSSKAKLLSVSQMNQHVAAAVSLVRH